MHTYFSQSGQDKFLNEKVFRGKKKGTFVDIGANDGVTLSNTCFFEKELGWYGMCIEPLNDAFAKLQKNRSSININACASTEDSKEYFLSVSGYAEMLSGLKSKYDERHIKRLRDTVREYGGSISEVEIQCHNISRLLLENGFSNIDFISLDTEGNELEVLNAIDFRKIHIKAITVENNFSSDSIKRLLRKNGFKKIATLDVDELYLNTVDFGFIKRMLIKYIY